jgi:hypothetical protein
VAELAVAREQRGGDDVGHLLAEQLLALPTSHFMATPQEIGKLVHSVIGEGQADVLRERLANILFIAQEDGQGQLL